jgi:hypothetical protein
MSAGKHVIPLNAGKFNDYYKFFGQRVAQKTAGRRRSDRTFPRRQRTRLLRGMPGCACGGRKPTGFSSLCGLFGPIRSCLFGYG